MNEIARNTEASSHLDLCGEHAAAMQSLNDALQGRRQSEGTVNDALVVSLASGVARSSMALFQTADERQIRDAIRFVFENYATYSPGVAKTNAATLFHIFKREKIWVGALYEGGLQCLKMNNRMPEVSVLYAAVEKQQRKLVSELRLIKTIQQT